MPQMAPLWWLTLYGLTLVVFLLMNWLSYYEGVSAVGGSEEELHPGENTGSGVGINWKW